MSICVIAPNKCSVSARKLALALGAEFFNLSTSNRRDFREFDVVFNYGSSHTGLFNAIINSAVAVSRCIDKIASFEAFNAIGVPTVKWTIDKNKISKDWNTIVCRSSAVGSGAKELEYCYDHNNIPDAALYTKYFDHEYEMRIVVFQGKVVGRYLKEESEGTWNFVELQSKGMKYIDNACINAAKALRIDYVGFDVLAKDCEDFVILEANSGPVLTDEVCKAICKVL